MHLQILLLGILYTSITIIILYSLAAFHLYSVGFLHNATKDHDWRETELEAAHSVLLLCFCSLFITT